MKKLLFIVIAFIMVIPADLNAQIDLGRVLKNVKKTTEKKIENKLEKKLNSGVDTVLNKTEKGITTVVKGDDKKSTTTPKDSKTNITDKLGKVLTPNQDSLKNQQQDSLKNQKQDLTQNQVPAPVLVWNTYDFVPGTEIIFEDDFKGEQNGEFPSRWDMVRGGLIENAVFDGSNVVYFKQSNATVPDAILPLLDVRTQDYLPDEFTFEMDCYFGPKPNATTPYYGAHHYYIFMYDVKNQKKIMTHSRPIRIGKDKVEYNQIGDTYPGSSAKTPFIGWRHVSISFNKRSLKGYLDDKRLLNIPNCEFNPTGIMISFHNVAGAQIGFIKNVKIAKGAVPLYDKVLSEGKFVTHGIKFDVNKATIKPESMGTINYVFKMLTNNPSLNFSVEGHTDSDGEDALNQKLSEARANAVMSQLVSMGIAQTRLKSKGLGESKPLSMNDTPEGKANNRRVEFIKF